MIVSLANKRLMIVDDEPDIGEILCWELSALGAQCFIAHGTSEAMAMLDKQELDGIISDIRMPKHSGTDLLKAIRQRSPQIPMLLMTGFSDLSLPRAHELGAEALLAKPFELDELCRTICYYTQPLLQRWRVEEFERPEMSVEQVDFGRGGLLIHDAGIRPKVKQEVVLQVAATGQVFRVVCRWHHGDSWAGEILAWDIATKERGWDHLNQVSFIPLNRLK